MLLPPYPDPRPGHRLDRASRTVDLVDRLRHDLDATTRRDVQDQLTVCNLPVARAVAARYRNRGLAIDDLEQVASLGLVKAVRRFEPDAGPDFLAYAVPTVRGEIRRHFRDRGWTVRPPRRIQDLQPTVAAAVSSLEAAGLAPTPHAVAVDLGCDLADVREAMALRGAFTPASLDLVVSADGATSLGDLLPALEPAYAQVEARTALTPLLRRMGERDRRILLLRFVRDCTQQEIADDIGVTQMQVSRLLTRIYADLRTMLGDPDPSTMAA